MSPHDTSPKQRSLIRASGSVAWTVIVTRCPGIGFGFSTPTISIVAGWFPGGRVVGAAVIGTVVPVGGGTVVGVVAPSGPAEAVSSIVQFANARTPAGGSLPSTTPRGTVA